MENSRKQPWEELEQDTDKNQPQSSRVQVISSMENGRKRPREELGLDVDQNQPQSSRMRTAPSFFSVIRGAMLAETIRHICLSMEPIIRRVVHEEVQLLVCGSNPLYGNRQYYIEEAVPTPQSQPLQSRDLPTHKLLFANQVPQKIYTNNNITANDKMRIKIQLVDINTGKICTNEEGSPIKVKIVVIDGDLELEGLDSDKFSSKIVKPRDGKRPLLVGNTEVNLNQGVGTIGDMHFTDNSKWLRSGKFRLGVCIDSKRCGTIITFQEGLSEKFIVKDHRGESSEKHYPPMPDDDIWRLDTIAKDGKYHQRLKKNGINIVQDFLKLLNENPSELKEILKMSENLWNKVVKHAQTCPTGLDNANLKSNADLPTWPHETQTGGTYGNGAESEAGASPIIYPSSSQYLDESLPNDDFWGYGFIA
ncbi:calmodulin-binding protein 60 E-like [Carex rostrata]